MNKYYVLVSILIEADNEKQADFIVSEKLLCDMDVLDFGIEQIEIYTEEDLD